MALKRRRTPQAPDFRAAGLCALALVIAFGGNGVAGAKADAAYAPTPTPEQVDVTFAPRDDDGNAALPSAPAVKRTEPPARVAPRPRAAVSAPVVVRGNSPGQAALAPPNGTYVYAIARDGADQGKSTVVIFRRAATQTIEVDESTTAGQFRAHVVAGFAYDTLLPNQLTATYQAPFPPSSLLGMETRFRPYVAPLEQTTVRYAFEEDEPPAASIDGVQGLYQWPLPPPVTRSPWTGLMQTSAHVFDTSDSGDHRGGYPLDGPVMSGWAMFPAWLRKSGATAITPVGAAFPEYVSDVRVARINLAPKQKRTPRNVIAKRIGDFATVWFDPQSQIVYELRLDSLNLDVRLLSYSKVTTTAPFDPIPATSPTPGPRAVALSVSRDNGVSLAGVLQFPRGASKDSPAIVLVAPPVGDHPPTRDYDGNASRSMFESIAQAFLAKGFAVARYDARGVGKSAGSYADLTWESSLEDLAGVVGEVQGTDGVDAGRVFVMGYGTGADLAFSVASDDDNKIAGVVALDPTLLSYHDALERQYVNAQTKPEEKDAAERTFQHELKRLGKPDEDPSGPGNGGVWFKSALAHNPAVLAARITVPAFVLHSSSTDPARTPDDVRAFDDRLRSADSLATVVVASDLSDHFGGRYDADAPENTEAMFPYAFDASTAGAIADWLGGIKAGMRGTPGNPVDRATNSGGVKAPPKPPPLSSGGHASSDGLPAKRSKPIDDVQPGQLTVPSTMGAPPTPSPAPTAPPTQSPPAPHAS